MVWVVKVTRSARRGQGKWSALLFAIVFLVDPGMPRAGSQSYSEGLLWRVSRPGIADSFVLGTIHIADPRITISQSINDALAQSRTLATELPSAALTAEEWAELEELDNAQQLDMLLQPGTFAEVCSQLSAQGIPATVVARLKPWAAMIKLSRTRGGAEPPPLDVQILSSAKIRRMRVESIESTEEQASSFDSIPLDSQVALLTHVLADRDALAAGVEVTVRAWLRKDLETLAQFATRAEQRFPGMGIHYEQLAKYVVRSRTSVMHHRLFMPLRAGRVFVAIGAMHLYGIDGMLRMLEDDGYRIQRMW